MSAFDLLRIFREAVAAVEPRAAVMRALSLDGGVLRAGGFSCDLAGVARILSSAQARRPPGWRRASRRSWAGASSPGW